MSAQGDANTIESTTSEDPYNEWLDRWLTEDFSWDALANKPRWLRQEGNDQQAHIRRLEGNADDSKLVESGKLIPVPGRGLYHVAFIPLIWARSEVFPLSEEELQNRQTHFWSRLMGSEFRDTYRGIVTGVHFPPDADAQLLSSTRASLDWCSIESSRLTLPSRGDRSFDHCFFHNPLTLAGNFVSSDTNPSLKISHSTIADRLNIENLEGAGNISLRACHTDIIDVKHSSLKGFTLDDCESRRISGWDVSFSSKFLIRNCALKAGIELISSKFSEDVEFIETDIHENLDLIRCDFEQRVTFADVKWPEVGYLIASLSGSRFRGLLTFASASPPPIQVFREATFEGGLALGRYTTVQWREMLAKELEAWERPHAELADKLSHSQNIENAARNIRRNAEGESDTHAEHFWHRSELVARRAREDIGLLESIFSDLYSLVADYGLSISRPFISIFVLTIMSSLLYWSLGSDKLFSGTLDWRSLEEALGFSMSRTLPIGAFGADQNSWRQELLGDGGTAGSIIVRTIATLQSLVSAVFIYLGVMAIRRKFKIN